MLCKQDNLIGLEYDFFEVPDRLRIYYDEKLIHDTGEVSGYGSWTYKCNGTNDWLLVVVEPNQEIDTEWWFLITCHCDWEEINEQ